MFDIKKFLFIDALTFIPGETQDDLLRIAIDLPAFRRIPKEGHITDYSKAESTVRPATLRYPTTPALYLDVFLSMKMCAKEGRKETTGEMSLRLPSVPFPWSLAVHHQSLAFRARLYDEKNEAPEEEAATTQFVIHFTLLRFITT